MTDFLGIDGEGITLKDNHIYTLVCTSEGDYLEDYNGLRSLKIFEFLFMVNEKNHDKTWVSFSFSYDVNMFLRNLPKSAIDSILRTNQCKVYLKNSNIGYRVEYLPRKFFTISKGFRNGGKWKTLDTIKIYDVWGFFQSSFIGALAKFNLGSEYLQEIQVMKNNRSNFVEIDKTRIREYCFKECQLLVELMTCLEKACHSAKLYPTSWHGAGALASFILKTENVKEHFGPELNEELDNAVRRAFFGGRVSNNLLGLFSTVYQYDIVSAYPHAMRYLPSLANGKWYKTKKYIPNRLGVYNVVWDTENVIAPFPFRDIDGGIHYCKSGVGWYWNPEVEVALKYYPNDIEILEGFIFEPSNSAKPFQFIERLFKERKRLKETGNHGELAIKLGLNSLYGKTAQSIGYRNSNPPYSNLIYAGFTTSFTRSIMLEAANQHPEKIIGFATDSIFSLQPLTLNEGSNLGQFEKEIHSSGMFVKPGFYRLKKDRQTKIKTRGIGYKYVDFDVMEKVFRDDGLNGRYTTSTVSFIGMKSASINRRWCTWHESEKTISFYPSRGLPIDIGNHIFRIENPPGFEYQSVPYSKDIQKNETEPENEYFDFFD
jgi:hypothetical protein